MPGDVSLHQPLSVDDAKQIADRIHRRQARFGETLEMSIMVVLLNYGDHLTTVSCTAGEWSGTKGDLVPGAGIPQCPNGHVLLEGRRQAPPWENPHVPTGAGWPT